MASIHDRLQDNYHKLVLQYDTARSDVSAMLDVLHDDVLPQLASELALSEPDVSWLSEWLSDVASIFRILRRHKFIRPFALQEIRNISIWRLRALRPILLLASPTLFHCLPPPITDPFGRPMVFLKLASLQSLSCSVQDALLQEVERLRLHLRYVCDHCVQTHSGSSPLQYLVLVDLDGVSIQNYNLDLFSWLLTDIIPRYPGLLAAVFLLNCSWIHSSAWSVAKRVLPSSTIARVFFPSKAQLLDYCSADTLPAEYGGSLPTLDQIDDALRWPYQTHHLLPPFPPSLSDLPITSQHLGKKTASPFTIPTDLTPHHAPPTIALSPFSARNPFFGYPAIASASNPHTIRPARRGLRQLIRTLAILWWRRWGKWVRFWSWLGMCGLLWVFAHKIRRARESGVRTSLEAMVHTMMDVIRAGRAAARM